MTVGGASPIIAMIVDHVSLPVRNLAVSAAFYDRVLATLGLQRRKERRGAIGWGPDAVLPPISGR